MSQKMKFEAPYAFIYFPMTAEILTPGHIKAIKWLQKKSHVIVGLLSEKALKGYKKCVVPYRDREFILKQFTEVWRQDSLDPSKNLDRLLDRLIEEFGTKYRVGLASGDGFEKVERDAAKRFGYKLIKINFPKTWSSSKIKQKIRKS